MRFTVRYGYRPGEKIVETGKFICPLCEQKREYNLILLQKRAWIFDEKISPFSLGEIGNFVICQGCFKPFPKDIIDSKVQFEIPLRETAYSSTEIINSWQKAYKSLECEKLLSRKTDIVETVSPYLFTVASHMLTVGAKLRMEEYEEAKQYLIAIINGALQWQDINIRQDFSLEKNMPKQHTKMLDHMDQAHIILSRLP